MSNRRVSFKEKDGVEVIWLNRTKKNTKKEMCNIDDLGGSRPTNEIERTFNRIIYPNLWICWTAYSQEQWDLSPVGTAENFNRILTNQTNLTKESFIYELMKVLNVLSMGRNYILDYKNSVILTPVVKPIGYRRQSISIPSIIRLWFIRIFKDVNFSAIRIQTIWRKTTEKSKFMALRRETSGKKIIKWGRNIMGCLADKRALIDKKKKRDRWMRRYIKTVPKFKELMNVKVQVTKALILSQQEKIKNFQKRSKIRNHCFKKSITVLKKIYDDKNSILQAKLDSLSTELSVTIPNESNITLVPKASPLISKQIVKVRANNLITALNDHGITKCILKKDFVVNVDSDIVVICSGKSQSYTIRLVGNRDQANWEKASVQLLRSNSLEEIVSTIKNRLSVEGFTKN